MPASITRTLTVSCILLVALWSVPTLAQENVSESNFQPKGQSVPTPDQVHLETDIPTVGGEDLLVQSVENVDTQKRAKKNPDKKKRSSTNRAPEKKKNGKCLLDRAPPPDPAFWQFKISPFSEMTWLLAFASGYMIFKGVEAIDNSMISTIAFCGMVDSAVVLSSVVPLDF
jgi:hypothetical protein